MNSGGKRQWKHFPQSFPSFEFESQKNCLPVEILISGQKQWRALASLQSFHHLLKGTPVGQSERETSQEI